MPNPDALLDGAAEPTAATRLSVERAMHAEALRAARAETIAARAATDFERDKLRAVFEHAPGAICTTRGPDHVIETANVSFVGLVGRDDPRGSSLRRLLLELSPALAPMLDVVRDGGHAHTTRGVRLLGASGIEGVFDVVLEPLAAGDAQEHGLVLFAVDVTETTATARDREVLIKALERQNRELDQFARIASHDLKTPLRGIASLTEWLEEDLGTSLRPESLAHLRLLRGRVTRLDALVDGILRFAQAGRQRHAESSVSLRGVLEEVVELLAPPSTVTIEIVGAMPTLRAERSMVEQVFLNLIGNAVKYADRRDARVEVRWVDTGDAFEITVADNGPGIAAAHHKRIFDLFDRATRQDSEGVGIGLSVVKKIVESRGGRVFVTSTLGSGATFHVVWPHERQVPSGV